MDSDLCVTVVEESVRVSHFTMAWGVLRVFPRDLSSLLQLGNFSSTNFSSNRPGCSYDREQQSSYKVRLVD